MISDELRNPEQREKLVWIAQHARRSSDRLRHAIEKDDAKAIEEVLYDLRGLGNSAASWIEL